jgi:hypothetical protein
MMSIGKGIRKAKDIRKAKEKMIGRVKAKGKRIEKAKRKKIGTVIEKVRGREIRIEIKIVIVVKDIGITNRGGKQEEVDVVTLTMW